MTQAVRESQLDDVRAAFAFLDSWEDRYRFIIDQGRTIKPLAERHRIDGNLVRGCQSQVWLTHDYDATRDRLSFCIDSDAHIVRGLVAIVLAACDGKSPRQILAVDMESLFDELDLVAHLSPARGNGLRAMVTHIRSVASDYADRKP